MTLVFLFSEPWPLADLEDNLKNETTPEELQDGFEFMDFDPDSEIFEGKPTVLAQNSSVSVLTHK
jgi:hypothetical protein